jgi:predicted short-subunit dehydrogenase-like oxidoreductase (DUF2520 family)
VVQASGWRLRPPEPSIVFTGSLESRRHLEVTLDHELKSTRILERRIAPNSPVTLIWLVCNRAGPAPPTSTSLPRSSPLSVRLAAISIACRSPTVSLMAPDQIVADIGTALRCAVVGAGRLGVALVGALPEAAGPFGRGFDGGDHEIVLLAVPDREIGTAAGAIAPGRLVGHCSGATGLDVLAPHECFGLHPLMTFPRRSTTGQATPFDGAGAAVAGSTGRALATATWIARRLGMEPFVVADADRAAYHAAASIAANFLITIEDAAEVLMCSAGHDRQILLPLIRASVENWGIEGRRALTGPVARGDHATVTRQRAAVASRAPDLLALFDALVDRTRVIAVAEP